MGVVARDFYRRSSSCMRIPLERYNRKANNCVIVACGGYLFLGMIKFIVSRVSTLFLNILYCRRDLFFIVGVWFSEIRVPELGLSEWDIKISNTRSMAPLGTT